MTFDSRHKSRTLFDGPDRAVARAMMKAAGFTAAASSIGSTSSSVVPG